MTGQELRRGVQDKVRAVLDGAQERRPKERVIGDDQQAVAVRQRGDGVEIGDPESRIRRGLEEYRPGRRRDGSFDGGEVRDVHAGHADPAAREVLFQQYPRDDE